MRLRDLLVIAIVSSPAAALAQPCVEMTGPGGQPSWQLVGSTASGSRWAEIEEQHCRVTCGGKWEFEAGGAYLADGTRVVNWCRDLRARPAGGAGTGGLGSGEIAGTAVAQAAMGKPDANVMAMGGLDLGIAANRYLTRLAQEGRAKRQLEEMARLERERLEELERERIRQEKWRETKGQLQLGDPGSLEMRTETTGGDIAIRFDEPSAPPAPVAPCSSQIAEMRKLGSEIETKQKALKADLDADARAYLAKEYGVDDLKKRISDEALVRLHIKKAYDEARALYESAYVEFLRCLETDKGPVECSQVGRFLEEKANALMDKAAKLAGIEKPKDRAERGAKTAKGAMMRSHAIFADAAPRATQILATPCP